MAIAAARVGVATTWVGRLGDDDLGSLVERELRGQGVDVATHRDPAAPTGLMVKEHRRGTPTRVRYYRHGSAGSRLSPDDLDPGLLGDADILHLTGITAALSDTARATLRRAVTLARDGGTTVSFDVNFRATLWSPEVAGPVLRELASAADIVFAGPEEAALLRSRPPHPGTLEDPWGGRRTTCPPGRRTRATSRRAQARRAGCLARADGTRIDHPIVPDRRGRPGRCR